MLLGLNQNGNCWYTRRQCSREWQAKDLQDTELGRVYGRLEIGIRKTDLGLPQGDGAAGHR